MPSSAWVKGTHSAHSAARIMLRISLIVSSPLRQSVYNDGNQCKPLMLDGGRELCDASAVARIWSGLWESNPRPKLGKLNENDTDSRFSIFNCNLSRSGIARLSTD